MAKKERLGSDPLSFIKDTRGETPQEKEIDKKQSAEATPAEDTKPAEEAKAKQAEEKKEGTNTNEAEDKPDKKETAEKKPSSGKKGKEETIKAENLSIKIKTVGNEQSLSFNGEMSIYNVKDIKESLVKLIKTANALELDMSGVSRIDTSAYQVILAARVEAEKNEKTLKVINPSGEVKKIFDLYGESLSQ